MKLKFKHKLFLYFFLIFATFSFCIIIIQQKEEKVNRTKELVSALRNYANIANNVLELKTDSSHTISNNSISNILPEELRLSLINLEGKLIYDKDIQDISSVGNHLDRPEIITAQYKNEGYNIRLSSSMHKEYIYYAKLYPKHYIRLALPYTHETKSLLQADNYFIYAVLTLFVIGLFLINYIANRFASSINKLKDYSSLIRGNKLLPSVIDFPNDELGDIASELLDIVKQKEQANKTIKLEKEKLTRHFNFLKEGLAMFDSNMCVIHYNTHFISYLNYIANRPVLNIEEVFELKEFNELTSFIKTNQGQETNYTCQKNSNGYIFEIETILYSDSSFEISIKDISKQERTRVLKQEMTSNIAHELRTPVTALRAYLETLEENQLSDEKRNDFIKKSHLQAIRLSSLIEDVSLISKMEESSSNFPKTKIYIKQIIQELEINLADKILEAQAKISVNLTDNLVVNGNKILISSIFSNLIENSIAYNDAGVEINIACYLEDKDFIYLSYYDNGKGIEEQYLNRIFERFYRISDGRARNTGGTGLGLSIVRNSVLSHQGEIKVKNREGGGLQFLFTLKK